MLRTFFHVHRGRRLYRPTPFSDERLPDVEYRGLLPALFLCSALSAGAAFTNLLAIKVFKGSTTDNLSEQVHNFAADNSDLYRRVSGEDLIEEDLDLYILDDPDEKKGEKDEDK